MTRRWVLGAGLVLGALVSGGGCGDDDDATAARARAKLAEGCVLNSDCVTPLVCAFERCHTQCKTTRDCPDGERCVLSVAPVAVCLPKDEDKPCTYNSDCFEGKICAQDGLCRDQCRTSRDCLREQYCASGSCVDGTEPTSSTDPGPVKPGQTPVGSACSYNSDCQDRLVCRNEVCAVACKSAVDCGVREQCVDSACVSVGGGKDVYCTPGATFTCDCAGGLRGTQTCLPDGTGLGECGVCQ